MPTDDQRALWSAIRANPLEDTPRLMYADWLQENGDEARAEFIRLQCSITHLDPDRRKGKKQRLALEAREKELFTVHRDKWLAPFQAILTASYRWDSGGRWFSGARFVEMPFRRGFLAGAEFTLISARMLAEAGDELEPVDCVEVRGGRDYDHASVVLIGQWSGAGCVTSLVISGATNADVAAIVRPDYLRNLSHLSLYGNVTDVGVEELAAWPRAASLKSLHLGWNPITNRGAFALAGSPYLTGLTNLDLHQTRITHEGFVRLHDRFAHALQISSATP
ncbi:MAG: TIGR02996 domain-containing protein [Planctomycetia bacterium]|nr:TIGR02996 domain-containing protein [Planctomycetia bacterium]